jgi:hypothetical protein
MSASRPTVINKSITHTTPIETAAPVMPPSVRDLFNEFKSALLAKNNDKLISLLKQAPAILLEKDSENNTPLHLAAKYCHNQKIIILILKELEKLNKCETILKSINKKGQTPLLLATKHNSYIIVKIIMHRLGDEANTVARMGDNHKQTPFTTILSNQTSDSKVESYKKFRLLKNTSTFNTAKKLSEPVTDNSDLKTNDNRIQRNLDIANKIINQVRTALPSSATHPQINGITIDEYNKLNEKVTTFRNTHPLYSYDVKKASQYWSSFFTDLQNNNVGNCSEMGLLALHKLRLQYPHIASYYSHIVNGDHVFVVIDPDANCDPWSGKSYPVSQITTQLEDFTNANAYNRHYNLLLKFNPSLYKLQLLDYSRKQTLARAAAPDLDIAANNTKRKMENQQAESNTQTADDENRQKKRIKT